jgi:hypothetical protein
MSEDIRTAFTCNVCGEELEPNGEIIELHHKSHIPTTCPDFNNKTESLGRVYNAVSVFFNHDDGKITQWINCPNPFFGGLSPLNMINLDKVEKVLNFIQAALDENHIPEDGEMVADKPPLRVYQCPYCHYAVAEDKECELDACPGKIEYSLRKATLECAEKTCATCKEELFGTENIRNHPCFKKKLKPVDENCLYKPVRVCDGVIYSGENLECIYLGNRGHKIYILDTDVMDVLRYNPLIQPLQITRLENYDYGDGGNYE